MYTMLLWIAYTALYYMSEPTVITSKYIRTNLEWVKMLYPLLMPFTIIYLSYQFQFSAIENQIPSFCRMFPERKNTGERKCSYFLNVYRLDFVCSSCINFLTL